MEPLLKDYKASELLSVHYSPSFEFINAFNRNYCFLTILLYIYIQYLLYLMKFGYDREIMKMG